MVVGEIVTHDWLKDHALCPINDDQSFCSGPEAFQIKNREMSFVVTSPVGLVSDEHLGSYQGRALKFRSQIGIQFIRSFFAVQVPSFREIVDLIL